MGFSISSSQIQKIASQIEQQDEGTQVGLSKSGELVTASGSRKSIKSRYKKIKRNPGYYKKT